jgi:hypothetical protein
MYVVSHLETLISHGLYDGSVALLDRSINRTRLFFGAVIN